MKKLILIALVATIFSCKKEEVVQPEEFFVKVFISNSDSATARYSFNVWYATDSTSFDTANVPAPDEVHSGIKRDLWNSTYNYYDAEKIVMDKSHPIYVIGYKTKMSDTLSHRFWFLPSNKNKVIEIPASEY